MPSILPEIKYLVKDDLDRSFRTIRLSLTSSCNMACNYCVDENYIAKKDPGLPANEYLDIIDAIRQVADIQTVRLTGGEPLLYAGLESLIAGLKSRGIRKVCLTTNASLLVKKVPSLVEVGLDSINISLDAIEPETYFIMSRRRNVEDVKNAIETVARSPIEAKINSTLVAEKNHHQVMPLFHFAKNLDLPIRYLELMNMGHLHQQNSLKIFTQAEILSEIGLHYGFTEIERSPSATAQYYEIKDGYRFGIIANESQPFCSDCDRLRIDSKGRIYGCLSSNRAFDIKDILDQPEKVVTSLQGALQEKQRERFLGSTMSMIDIGG